MSDGYDFHTQEIDLSDEHAPDHGLSGVMHELQRFKRRRDLLRSSVYRELRHAIGRATFASAHRRFSSGPGHDAELVRAVTWNVERGRRLPALLEVLRDEPRLRTADVLILNEVDVGMARSGNVDVPGVIARELGFDYVFGNCYLCLAPGNQRDGPVNGDNRLGLHGNAILSRFPIERAESFSVPLTHDLFESREKRLGHRKALWARVRTPRGGLTVLCVHLDTEGSPGLRGRQMRRALAKLEERGVADRVLVGGDFNTTTYDTASMARLLANLAAKVARGGFPHALHHYLHPYELYERPVFEALRQAGYQWRPLNQSGVGSLRFEVGDPHTESTVHDHLPWIGVPVLRYKLRPWNGVAELKLDWFAGRGIRALGDGEILGSCGRTSEAPATLRRTTWQGQPVSDHDPVAVDIELAPAG